MRFPGIGFVQKMLGRQNEGSREALRAWAIRTSFGHDPMPVFGPDLPVLSREAQRAALKAELARVRELYPTIVIPVFGYPYLKK